MSKNKLRPIHPGEILQEEFLVPLNVTQSQLARDTAVAAWRFVNRLGATEAEIVAAAKAAHAHDFIMSLPDNYDFDVKERGVMLSSGQRQLIAFLRAFVSNPSILILDEATSSIDTYSEELIQRATETITEGRTSIVIAHRLATIVNADKIVVMDKGLIVEEGTHQELINRETGYYKNLYDSQFSVAN